MHNRPEDLYRESLDMLKEELERAGQEAYAQLLRKAGGAANLEGAAIVGIAWSLGEPFRLEVYAVGPKTEEGERVRYN